MAKFTLTVEDEGQQVVASHEFIGDWKPGDEEDPPGAYLAGGMILRFLDEALEFELQPVDLNSGSDDGLSE